MFPPAASVLCGTMAGLYLWDVISRRIVLYRAGESAGGMAAEAVDCVAPVNGMRDFIVDLIPGFIPDSIPDSIPDFVPGVLTGVFYATVLVIVVFLGGVVLLRRSAPPRRIPFFRKSNESNHYVSVSYLRYRYGKHLYCLGLLALFCMGFWHGFQRQMPAGVLSGTGVDRSVVSMEDSLRKGRGKRDYKLLFAEDRSVVPAGEQVFLCLRVRDFPVHVTTATGREYMRMECRLVLYSPDGREQIPGNENIQVYVLVDSAGRKEVPATGSGVQVTGSEVPVTGSGVSVTGSEVPVTGSGVPGSGNLREASYQWLPGDVLFTRCRSFPFTSGKEAIPDTTATGPNAITTGSNANPSSTHPDTTDLHAATTGPQAATTGLRLQNAGPNALTAGFHAPTTDPHATTTWKDNASDSAKTNTTTFDYSKYMARRGFFRRAYVYKFQRVKAKLTIFERLKRLRVPITKSWEGEAGALLSGICLGDKTGLTPEMRDRFSAAGAGHILAVSGLHVGILYGSLVLLLGIPLRIKESRRYKRKPERKPKPERITECIQNRLDGKNSSSGYDHTPQKIYARELALRRTYSLTRGTWIHIPALLLIWIYAGVVGFSASVVRAALMLTVYGIGKMTGRRAFGLNVLSLAALILVIVEPLNLYDIGFQMSFSAVLGLILFFPLLRNLLSVRKRLLKYIWELLCCSMAVQLGTLWLTTASFGIIPLYGLVCNLVVVPFCTVILYVFLCYLIAMGFYNTALPHLNELLHILAGWLENTVSFFAGLPLTPIHYQPGPGGQILILFCTAIVYILLRRNDRNL